MFSNLKKIPVWGFIYCKAKKKWNCLSGVLSTKLKNQKFETFYVNLALTLKTFFKLNLQFQKMFVTTFVHFSNKDNLILKISTNYR